MFTFDWSELLVVAICGLVLFLGLAFLMLRRRNEILQKFLTPEEPNLEEEFFRVRAPKQEETPSEALTESETDEMAEESDAETARWGAPDNS
jgi:hypothetical protein